MTKKNKLLNLRAPVARAKKAGEYKNTTLLFHGPESFRYWINTNLVLFCTKKACSNHSMDSQIGVKNLESSGNLSRIMKKKHGFEKDDF